MSGLHDHDIIKHAYIIYIDNPQSFDYAMHCAKTCIEFDLPYTLVKGYSNIPNNQLQVVTGFQWIVDGAYLDCVQADEGIDSNIVNKELNCTASHLKVWDLISKQKHACAVFEHDVVVKYNIKDLPIPEDSITMLGYRLLSSDHYSFPSQEMTFQPINSFQGAHAYAMSPITAKRLLNNLSNEYTEKYGGIDATVDGLISIENNLGVNKFVVDPPVAMAIVGDRISTIRDCPAKYNVNETQGFINGLTKEGIDTFKPVGTYTIFNDGIREYVQINELPLNNNTEWSVDQPNRLTGLFSHEC